MRGVELVTLNRLLQHHIAGHTEQIVTRRIAIVEVVRVLFAILPNTLAIIRKCLRQVGAILMESEFVKGALDESCLFQQMFRTHGAQLLHILRFAVNYQIIRQTHRRYGMREIVVSTTLIDFHTRIGAFRQIEIRCYKCPVTIVLPRECRRRIERNNPRARPMTQICEIIALLRRNLVPEIVAHFLEKPDIIAYYEALIADTFEPLIHLDFHRAVVRVHVHKNKWRL